jgi:hypothetical protein
VHFAAVADIDPSEASLFNLANAQGKAEHSVAAAATHVPSSSVTTAFQFSNFMFIGTAVCSSSTPKGMMPWQSLSTSPTTCATGAAAKLTYPTPCFTTAFPFHPAPQVGRLLSITRAQISRGQATSVVPFNAITLPFTLDEILAVARLHSAKACKDVKRVPLQSAQLRVPVGAPLRVGYLSADWRHIHPVGRDLAAILPKHSHRYPAVCPSSCRVVLSVVCRVRSFGYAINPPRVNDSSRERVVKEMGKFVRVDDMVDSQVTLPAFTTPSTLKLNRIPNPCDHTQVISTLTADELHVVVDLMGYTHGAKERVLAASPAPLVIAWKGFMGSSGSSHVSLVTTDPVTSTPELAPFFSEKFLYVRPAFFVSGHATTHANVLADPPSKVSRANAGLPQDAFIFGSFNTLYKIDPALWAVWMQILIDVPNSVCRTGTLRCAICRTMRAGLRSMTPGRCYG